MFCWTSYRFVLQSGHTDQFLRNSTKVIFKYIRKNAPHRSPAWVKRAWHSIILSSRSAPDHAFYTQWVVLTVERVVAYQVGAASMWYERRLMIDLLDLGALLSVMSFGASSQNYLPNTSYLYVRQADYLVDWLLIRGRIPLYGLIFGKSDNRTGSCCYHLHLQLDNTVTGLLCFQWMPKSTACYHQSHNLHAFTFCHSEWILCYILHTAA